TVASEPVCLEDGSRLSMTVSVGISDIRPRPGVEDLKPLGERLIAEADVQLYRAKTEGRNRVCLEHEPG
ncbi:MAG: hypothetical protein ACR2QU_06680, partial [Gammaproteobacteria bacterium]